MTFNADNLDEANDWLSDLELPDEYDTDSFEVVAGPKPLIEHPGFYNAVVSFGIAFATSLDPGDWISDMNTPNEYDIDSFETLAGPFIAEESEDDDQS